MRIGVSYTVKNCSEFDQIYFTVVHNSFNFWLEIHPVVC